MSTEKSTKKTSKKRTERKGSTRKKSVKKTAKKTAKKASSKKVSKKVGKTAAEKAVSRNDGRDNMKASHRKALERSENYAAAGLAAQVTETLLDEIRALDQPWSKTPEAIQAVVISRLSDRVANAMTNAVSVLSARGHKAVICNLAAVTFKEGVRGTIVVGPGSDMRHELADYATRDCVIVLADPTVFMEGLAMITPDADQQKLI